MKTLLKRHELNWQVAEALQTVGKFLKDDTGSSWLASVSHNEDEALTTEELMREIINSTGSNGVREAAGIITVALELQKSAGKANESLMITSEGLEKFIETIADRDDVMCLYRTKSEGPGMRADWEKTAKTDLLKGYDGYLALDTGLQEVLCVKRKSSTQGPDPTVNSTPETSSIPPEELPQPITPGNEGANVPNEVDVNNSPVNESEETVGKSSTSANSSASDLESMEALPALEASNSGEEMPFEVKMRSMTGGSRGPVNNKIKQENPCCPRNDDLRNYVNSSPSKDTSSSRKSFVFDDNPPRESSNYALYVCPFHEICRKVKAPERQYKLMNIPSHLSANNESPERLLNPHGQHSLFSRNGNGFVKNLHDNAIVMRQGYSKNMNTYIILRKRNSEEENENSNPFDSGDHQNFPFTQMPVKPSSEFVASQVHRGGYPWVFLDPYSVLARSYSEFDSRRIGTSGNRGNDNFGGGGKRKMPSLKIFVNSPSREPVRLSICTRLDAEIEVYHNKEELEGHQMSQVKLKKFNPHGDDGVEGRGGKLSGEIDRQDYKHTFDALMDLLTSRD
ncbi:uncharacterized protein LOC135164120 isoform X2 [Diachasmimorpha longicaudata]|uniref:uncharacterized protein LOC135164120 isoform X2 n=1 Tax=Diachasmimorpha longicaudata TaxID=58733 RepID=UPI0030B910AC